MTKHTGHIPAVAAVLDDPFLNRRAAFTPAERDTLGRTGRLPSAVLTQDQQAQRAYAQLQAQPTDLAKNVYLEQLHDRNEVLYYKTRSCTTRCGRGGQQRRGWAMWRGIPDGICGPGRPSSLAPRSGRLAGPDPG